jgi:hypothetical protein
MDRSRSFRLVWRPISSAVSFRQAYQASLTYRPGGQLDRLRSVGVLVVLHGIVVLDPPLSTIVSSRYSGSTWLTQRLQGARAALLVGCECGSMDLHATRALWLVARPDFVQSEDFAGRVVEAVMIDLD